MQVTIDYMNSFDKELLTALEKKGPPVILEINGTKGELYRYYKYIY